MTTITIPKLPDEIHIKELTSKDGNGVLDVMLSSVKTLLHTEFKENRLRGTDYSNAFVQLIPHVLQQAGSYSLAKAKLPYEIELLKKELFKADADIAASEKQQLLVDAQIKDILKGIEIKTYQLNDQMPVETVNLTKQGSQLDAQTQSITKETEIKSYQLSTQLPIETANLTKQGEMLVAQKAQLTQETANAVKQGEQIAQQTTNMVAEKSRIEADTARVAYETSQVLPKQLEQTDAQIAQVGKQTDLLTYELTNLKPKELAAMTEQVNVAKQEVALKTKQVEITDYELQHKLPVEIEQMTAQTIKIVSDVNNTIKEGKLVDANRCRVNAETAMVTANLNQKLPKELAAMDKDLLLRQAQIDLGVKDLALKGKQVDIATKELSLKDEELKLAQYNFTYKAPSEVAKTQGEAEYYQWRAKSERAQTDPSAVMSGSYLDKNMKVLDEQSRQYLRSSQQSLVANLIDTWKVRYNADPDNTSNNATAQNKLADPFIGAAITKAAAEIGINL